MYKFFSASKISEQLEIDQDKIRWLKRLINQGEGQKLEFKAKTNFPEKIVHELIAFANSDGGTLLVGINDDGNIGGVKYPEEDTLLIFKALHKHCWPRIKVKSTFVKVNEKKWVVILDVASNNRKPARFKLTNSKQIAYLRYQDKTLQASREAEGILHLKHGKNAVGFTYGEFENKIIKTLDSLREGNFNEVKLKTGIPGDILSSKLIRLAAANVIGWKPLDKTDLFYSLY